MINTLNNANIVNNVNTQKVDLTSSVALLSKRCSNSTYRGVHKMKVLTQREPAISAAGNITNEGTLDFINDPALVDRCKVGIHILQYRNRNTEVSEEMRRILVARTKPQRRHTDEVPFSTKETPK